MKKPGEVEQLDLTPTVALSLGLPISQKCVGHVIPDIIEGASLRDHLRFLHLIGHQLSCLLKDNFLDYGKEAGFEECHLAKRAHDKWMKCYMEENISEVLARMGKKVLKQYLETLSAMRSTLRKKLGKYDMYCMIAGLVFTLQPLFVLLLAMPEALNDSAAVEVPVISALLSLPFFLLCMLLATVHVLVCTSDESSCYFCNFAWGLVLAAIACFSAMSCLLLSTMTRRLLLGQELNGESLLKISSSKWSELDVLLLAGTASHILSFASSSFIEEEHLIWYFLVTTLCLAVFQEVCQKYFGKNSSSGGEEYGLPYKVQPKEEIYTEKWPILATPLFLWICCRVLHSINQTGGQWAHLPDLGQWINSTEQKVVLSLLSTFCLVLIYFLIQRRCSLVSKVALTLGLLDIYSYLAALDKLLFPWQHSGQNMPKSYGLKEKAAKLY